MKNRIWPQPNDKIKTELPRLIAALALLALATINPRLSTCFAQGTAFTYQGQLFDNGVAANGSYALRCTIFDSSNSPMNVVGGPLVIAPVAVSNGLFTVLLDFGPGEFTGPPRWLLMETATNSVSPIYIPMTPRQLLSPAPYSIFAGTASNLSGTLPTAQLSGTIPTTQLSGTVANSQLASNTITVTAIAGLGGGGTVALGSSTTLTNTGVLTVTGNADITAAPTNGNVILGDTATSTNAPNTIVKRDGTGNFSVGTITGNITGTITGNGSGLTNVNAAAVNGLKATNFWQTTGNAGADPAKGYFLGTIDTNALELRVNGQRGLRLESSSGGPTQPNVIGGSSFNSVVSPASGATISGGLSNTNNANYATIGGGAFNTIGAASAFATLGGGYFNSSSGQYATVGGGWNNTASGISATVPGGYNNIATGDGSFAAGRNAQAPFAGNFVWGDGTQPWIGSGVNHFDVLASGGVLFCDGGTPSANAQFEVQTLRHGSAENTATFVAPNIGPNESHIHYGTTGDWYIRSASSSGKVVLQDTGGSVGIGTATPQHTLDVNGGFVGVQGGGAQAGIGGLSGAGGVMVGSFDTTVTSVSFQNLAYPFPYMHINCSSITIEGGADLAEPFQISSADKNIPQGAVVVIDEENPGHLKVSEQSYDTRVAGVVSGANGINPGIQMQQQGLLEGGKNVALTGRVYVRADASGGPINPGDLLTTSNTPGHAMKVNDHARAQGAILGKAMTALKEGKGMVLVLVTLQ